MATVASEARVFAALLFDMDGTLVDSTDSVERAWSAWAQAHGVEVAPFLATVHGVQAAELIRRLGRPDLDPAAEARRVMQAELADLGGVTAIGGAAALLAALPRDRWAIVTSAPRELAAAKLAAAGLPAPEALVAAEDAPRSKPAPDGFRLAAERLGVDPAACLVFEDAAAGVEAAVAAGATVVGVGARAGAPAQIDDFSSVRVEPTPGGVRVSGPSWGASPAGRQSRSSSS